MKLKKYILLSVISVISVFGAFGIINKVNAAEIAPTVIKSEKKEHKSMIECMRNQGQPEHVIQHTIEMMEKYGYNPYDFVSIN